MDQDTGWTLPPLQAGAVLPKISTSTPVPPANDLKRSRAPKRSKAEMVEEKVGIFDSVLNLKAAGVCRRQRFDYAFTTDGVCARLQMSRPVPSKSALAALPSRGIWAIDELKRVSRLEEMHVVGVDPGKLSKPLYRVIDCSSDFHMIIL